MDLTLVICCIVVGLGWLLAGYLERRRDRQDAELWREMWASIRADTRRMHLEDEEAGFTPRQSLAQEMEGLSQWEAEASRRR